MRTLTREEFLVESGASAELVDRLIAVDAVVPLADGRFDARDEVVASMAGALLGSGIALDDLAWSLDSRRFGLRSLGEFFTEPVPRTAETFADLEASLGDGGAFLLLV